MTISSLIALAALFIPGSVYADGDRVFEGPQRYCGLRFAIDLQAGERIRLRYGPDYLLEGLESPSGGFGLYEGFAPQDGRRTDKVEAGLNRPTYRVGSQSEGYGYVVWTGDNAREFYTHVWGQVFKGTAEDYPLLRRLQFGGAAKRGCAKPSVEQQS
ncbi:hypothetical protein [Sphingomonas sp. R1]|uniref:hypothetical protein n=1 Tax=Sphingomonas sp. R1 TaxID=399176 RepID=UPI002224AC4E|nr:hypothetical protein [Sphingomonas sp. R1]UYY79004.1 hypothetical protein OIM94_08500 [Sphingomonas sp. R1]